MSGYIAAYIVLICLSAFFSASEMCFSSANRMRLESAAEGGSRGPGSPSRSWTGSTTRSRPYS